MGFPFQIVIGKRGLKNGTFELKDRATGEREDISLEEAASIVAARVNKAKQALC